MTSNSSAGPTARVRTRWRGWLPYLIVGAAFVTTYALTVWQKTQFAPDSRYYFAMALHFGGVSQEDATAQVAALSAEQGWAGPPQDQLFGWGLVQPRVVFPALAMPFVKIFGVQGLAVVSGLALAALVVVLTVLLQRRYGAAAAAGTMLLLASSTQVMFSGSAMITESLSALWTALVVVVAFRYVRDPQRSHVVMLVVLTIVSGFTRQATLIAAGALFGAWLAARVLRSRERWGVPALAVGVTTVVVQVLQTWLFPTFSQSNQFLKATGTDSLAEALAATPGLMWDILRANGWQWAAVDLAVPVLLVGSLVSMIVLWRRAESHLLLGALLAVILYNVTNGTPVGIRYAMPGLVFFALAFAQGISATARVLSDDDSRSIEPQTGGAG